MTPEELAAREAIRDVIARYCRGIDRRDRALVAGCFHADATDDHGTGPRPIHEFLDWCFDLLDQYDSTFHLVGQTLIRVEPGAGAWAETYGIAQHRTAGGHDRQNLVTGFRYVDQMTAVDGEWRIQHRIAVTDWSRVDRADHWWDGAAHLLHGVAGRDDPSYDV